MSREQCRQRACCLPSPASFTAVKATLTVARSVLYAEIPNNRPILDNGLVAARTGQYPAISADGATLGTFVRFYPRWPSGTEAATSRHLAVNLGLMRTLDVTVSRHIPR